MPGKNKNRQDAASGPPAGARRVSLNHHKGHCAICRHPHRADIEYDFLRWRSVHDIVDEFKLHNRRIVYRHAHATRLWERRSRNLQAALEALIEGAENVKVTGDTVIRAVIAHCRINDQGKYVEPVRHVVISRVRETQPNISRHTERLEQGPTD
jgi:hypothetical protein